MIMRQRIIRGISVCLLPFGLVMGIDTDTAKGKLLAIVAYLSIVFYAGIIFLPLCVLAILLLFSNLIGQDISL